MRILLLALLMFGCAGDEPPGTGECTGQLYEACLEEHDCSSALCQNFIDEGFQVCTTVCSDAMACPGAATCDLDIGMCVPDAPLECTID